MVKKSVGSWFKDTRKIISLSILLIAFSFTYQYAYADVPNIGTFIADDPDDGDTVYSNGDTFTLTFSLPINVTASATMSQGAINGNFTLSGGASFGATYSGLWSADKLTLVITVTDVTGATIPAIGVTTISASGTSNLGHDGDPPTSATLTGTPTLGGDYGQVGDGGSRNGCAGDCMAPTLGVNEEGNRLVTNGFTYNGKPIDVERYFTPYPLITVEVGKKNTAVFKIYEDNGPQNIQHFDFAFGLADGQIIGESKAIIRWDRGFDGIETVTVVDPNNVLQDIDVVTTTGKCTEDANQCLIVTVDHTFRAPLDFNIVGTNVWDERRNGWQNYYNDGIKIEGDSMNPPEQIQVLDRVGHPVTITLVDKTHGIDKDGRQWILDHGWRVADVLTRDSDSATMHGVDRTNSMFGIYKKGQELIAADLVKSKYGTGIYQSFEFPHLKSINDKYVNRADDAKLQQKMLDEELRAMKKLDNKSRMLKNDT